MPRGDDGMFLAMDNTQQLWRDAVLEKVVLPALQGTPGLANITMPQLKDFATG
jgi:hypothetical protein